LLSAAACRIEFGAAGLLLQGLCLLRRSGKTDNKTNKSNPAASDETTGFINFECFLSGAKKASLALNS